MALARSEAPALILMDMALPKLDGWSATKLLKASKETKAIPIIGLSAHAMVGDREAWPVLPQCIYDFGGAPEERQAQLMTGSAGNVSYRLWRCATGPGTAAGPSGMTCRFGGFGTNCPRRTPCDCPGCGPHSTTAAAINPTKINTFKLRFMRFPTSY